MRVNIKFRIVIWLVLIVAGVLFLLSCVPSDTYESQQPKVESQSEMNRKFIHLVNTGRYDLYRYDDSEYGLVCWAIDINNSITMECKTYAELGR